MILSVAKYQINKKPPIRVLIMAFNPKYISATVKAKMAKPMRNLSSLPLQYKNKPPKSIMATIKAVKSLNELTCGKTNILLPFCAVLNFIIYEFYKKFLNNKITERLENGRA